MISKGVTRLRSSLWWAPLPITTTSSCRPRSHIHRPRVRSQSPPPYWWAVSNVVLPRAKTSSSSAKLRSSSPSSWERIITVPCTILATVSRPQVRYRTSRDSLLSRVPEAPSFSDPIHRPHNGDRLVQRHNFALCLARLQAPHDLGGLVVEAVAGDRSLDGLVLFTGSGDRHRARAPPGGVNPHKGFRPHDRGLLGCGGPDADGEVGEPAAFVLEDDGSLL